MKISKNMLKMTKFKEISLVTSLGGLILIYMNIMLFFDKPQIFAIFNMVAAVVILGFPLIFKYSEFSRVKKIENMFPKYLRDLSEAINTGMTLPQAMKSLLRNDYSALTPYVKDMNAKITYGISFERVLNDFADKTGSSTMRRNIQTIIETHRSGGTMSTVLKSVSESLHELDKIKKERSASIYAQMLNGYLIFVVFLGVMVGLSQFLLPTFKFSETQPGLQMVFSDMFRYLIVIQGFFAGMSIGKMAEGRFVAGIKHSMVMMIFGYSVFVLMS